ncbi:cancer-related nucleoside-triphosphatase-like [Lynx rufus]|uniref:cancer-related nucleoside-triphosphatase-like n=1 Tax=Lynx rufus TaxID=61384 RepID=UPI001F127E7E|nr:cancer-related nucleoside-triphosphatase-like [Lynx rufus]
MARHVFLTGPPGVGKTALVQKASKILKSSGVPVNGFTQKSDREEIGFNVVTSSCTQEVSSRIGSEPLPGKRQCGARQYVVYLTPSEQSPLPVLRNAGPSRGPGQRVCVMDETGKVELLSQPFVQAVRQTLSTPGVCSSGHNPTTKGKPLAFVEELRNRYDVRVFSVTKENRNHLSPDSVTCVQSGRK